MSLMPLSMAEWLGIRGNKPSKHFFRLAEPYVLMEDTTIQVSGIPFPCNFMVIDMEEDSEVLLVVGSPYLKTVGVVFNISGGRSTLNIGAKNVSFAFSPPD